MLEHHRIYYYVIYIGENPHLIRLISIGSRSRTIEGRHLMDIVEYGTTSRGRHKLRALAPVVEYMTTVVVEYLAMGARIAICTPTYFQFSRYLEKV